MAASVLGIPKEWEVGKCSEKRGESGVYWGLIVNEWYVKGILNQEGGCSKGEKF